MTGDLRERCPACGGDHTYWTCSSVDGDVWDCGSCGHQWTVEVDEMIVHESGRARGSHQTGRLILLRRISAAHPL